MKLLMLIHSGPHEDRLTKFLDAHDAGGYTELRDVHGAGATGRILGTRAWPGSATILFSVVPAQRVDELVRALRDYKTSLAAGEHLHVAVLPVEDYF
jgi:hypothetical protein